MTPELWKEVAQAHEQLEEMPPEQFDEFRNNLSPEVRAEVEKVLRGTTPYQPPLERAPVIEDPGEIQPGDEIDSRFLITAWLGDGGMGTVYRAKRTNLEGPDVALKFLHPQFSQNEEFVRNFKREVVNGQKITHKNVCRIHEFHDSTQPYFLSMELIEGEPLNSLLKKVRRLTPEKTLQIAQQICDGVGAIHEKNLIHRDLKPGNVMIDEKGNVRITDFGLAFSQVEEAQPKDRSRTPAYASPEQTDGEEITEQSDLYSLGLVLHELYTGQQVFKGGSETELREARKKPIPDPSDVASGILPHVDKIIARCLKQNPDERPRNAQEVRDGLVDPFQITLGEGTGSLSPRTAWLCLTGVALALITILFCTDRATWFGRARPKAPRVLKENAKDRLRALGYEPDNSIDDAFGFVHNKERLEQIPKATPTNASLDASGSTARVRYWYRISSTQLFPNDFEAADYTWWYQFKRGRVSPDNPPALQPGMVCLFLDPQGMPLLFTAVPTKRNEKSDPESVSVETWEEWFRAFLRGDGMDEKNWTEERKLWTCKPNGTLQTIPTAPTDQRMIWTRKNGSVHVEAAAWQGRLTYVYRKDSVPKDQSQPPQESSRWVSYGVQRFYFTGFTMIGLVIAWKNWRLGRGDVSGAVKLGCWIFSTYLLTGLLCSSHLPTAAEMVLWNLSIAAATWLTFTGCVFYLALEPYVRKSLPGTLHSWHRLLAGRFRDPYVGRDLLAGILFGALGVALNRFGVVLDLQLGMATIPYLGGILDVSHFPRLFLAETCHMLGWSVIIAFCFLLYYWSFNAAALRLFPVRGSRVAFTFGLFFLTVMVLPSAEGNAFAVSRLVLSWAGFVFVLVRFGFLAICAWHFVYNFLDFPMTSDPDSWYFDWGVAVLVIIFGIACYASCVACGKGTPAQRTRS